MKFGFKLEKKRLIWFGIMTLLAVIMFFTTRYPVIALPAFAALMFVMSCIHVEFSEKLPWLWTGILFGVGAVLTELCMQFVILMPESFAKLDFHEHLLNVLIVAAVYFFFQLIVSRPAIAAGLAHTVLVIFAYVNYFVYAVRGNEITYADIATVGTGLSVAKNYSFVLHDRGAAVIMATLLYLTFLAHLIKIKFKRPLFQRIISAAFAVGLMAYVIAATQSVDTQTWEQKGSYQNGFALNFVLSIRDNFVSPPDGYSAEEVQKIADEYADAEAVQNVSTNEGVKNPTVIMIMDESFADLNVIGELNLNIDDYMPYIRSLKENTVSGYALASVYGAKTPNSEWETLTGNTMAFLPSGSVVYQQYIDDDPTSLVSTLKNEGYTTVAMHPYYETGWSRNTVYPKLGFDETYFLDNPAGYFDETNILRKYVTDEELFDKMIERFESKDDEENLFLMGITMQNHGGYKNDYEGFEADVVQSPGIYSDANQYLTVARETDKAVQKLIEYFESVDEPVEILFFGDHQPSLGNDFYAALNGKGMAGLTMDELEDFFKVPFFIWTNYETESEEIEITSLNYLSTLTLERGNFELPTYNKFLADLMQYIPAINSRGYYSLTTGEFEHFEDATGEEAEWLWKYEVLQYNSMFDEDDRNEELFPYIEDE